jgi:pantetheine-phosphate adenylyltransferase
MQKPRAGNQRGAFIKLDNNGLKNSPSCLADYFSWPQVALTHHGFQALLKHCRRTLSMRRSPGRRDGSFFYLPFTIYDLPSSLMRRAIYPGSFDPVTNGHLDIIQRGCKLFDEIIIAILINPEKTPFFSVTERKEILAEVLKDIERSACKLVVDSFEGLLVQYAAEKEAHAIVRGIRAISDYEYELQMALMNRRLEPALETVFMMPAEAYSYVSSRLVKEVFQLGGDISGLVPAVVEEQMRRKAQKP